MADLKIHLLSTIIFLSLVSKQLFQLSEKDPAINSSIRYPFQNFRPSSKSMKKKNRSQKNKKLKMTEKNKHNTNEKDQHLGD